MRKRVTLTLSSGSFDEGFPAILRIQEDNAIGGESQYGGKLPPAPDIPGLFFEW